TAHRIAASQVAEVCAMKVLTLTPHRCGKADGFEEGTYAYAFADRAVRKDGILLTPQPLFVKATALGRISFLLTPSSVADGDVEFSYSIAAYDPTGRRMWLHNIIMPDDDAELYDLVPETVDLDAPTHVPKVCPEEVVPVYCGATPVDPSAGIDSPRVVTMAGGGNTSDTHHVTSIIPAAEYTSLFDGEVFWLDLRGYTAGPGSIPGSPFRLTLVEGGPSDTFGTTPQSFDAVTNNMMGEVITFGIGIYVPVTFNMDSPHRFTVDFQGIEETSPWPTQAEIDAYQLALTTYNNCIANGGTPGDAP
ncbi:MAG: hypothetical protein KAG66_16415, partial [Methylococcales bacterium]|nr:hypothetical protein [Methylococcales bacterium]